MKALIMAAGVGSRLEPLTLAVPKPMFPILGKPIMQYNIELLSQYGITDITSNLHYFPEQIENYFSDGSRFGVNLNYSFEEELLGTAGGVYRMARVINDINETFIVLSADTISDIDLAGMIDFHKRKKSSATIALKKEDDVTHYGVVILDENGRVKAFQEKPEKGKELSSLVNTGIYILEPQILDMIPPDRFYDFGKQLFPILVEKRVPFYGFEFDSNWCDAGTIPKYKQANFDLGKGRIFIGKNAKIAKSARILEGSIIGDGCIVRDGAKISKSIIWSDTIIDSDVKIKGSIIGNWCYIEHDSEVEDGSIIANRCRIRAGQKLTPDIILNPDQIV